MKKNALQTKKRKIKVKSTIQGSTGEKEKGKGKGNEVRWRENLKQACSTGFWEGKCGTNMESTGTKENMG